MAQASKSRQYCFTLNNYTEEEENIIQAWGCQYLVYGREKGVQNATPHLQGYVRFTNARNFNAVRKLMPRAHWEIARSAPASEKYCKKDGDFFEKGDPPQQNGGDPFAVRASRNKRLRTGDLEELVASGELSITQVPIIKKARMVLDAERKPYDHSTVRGKWFYGPPGSGKTTKAREFGEYYQKDSTTKWWDDYQGEKNVVMDDFDHVGVERGLGHFLKIWADKWSCRGEIKGGSVQLQHHTFCVTSNYHPRELFGDTVLTQAIERRFEIISVV